MKKTTASRSDRSTLAVTGLGVTCPLGVGVEPFWKALCAGRDALAPTPSSFFDAPVPPLAYTLQSQGFEPEDHADPRLVRRLSRISAISLIAALQARDASRDAQADAYAAEAERAGVILGTSFGSGVYHFEYYNDIFEHGLKEASPLLFSENVMNAASGHITHHLGLRGAGLTLVGGEDIGLQSLFTALDKLRAGHLPFAIAGGSDEYCDLLHASLARRGIVGAEAGRPFDAEAAPCPYGEGSATLLLETLERARAAGRSVAAVFVGAGTARRGASGDPEEAAVYALQAALEDASVDASQVDLVVSGARGGDVDDIELAALMRVLDSQRALHVCAPKSWLGECFAFSSAAQAVVAALALEHGVVPPTRADGRRAAWPSAWSLPAGAVEAPLEVAVALSATPTGGATAVVFRAASSV